MAKKNKLGLKGPRMILIWAGIILIAGGMIWLLLGSSGIVEQGDLVKISYTGTDSSGNTVDRDSIEFEVGAGTVEIPGFDTAILEMKVGESKSITLEPYEAYGVYNPANVFVVERTVLIDKLDYMTLPEFEYNAETEPVVGHSYDLKGFDWPIEVIEIVPGISSTKVVYVNNPEENMTIDTLFGIAQVTFDIDTVFVYYSNAKKDMLVSMREGLRKVVSVNETEIVVDNNPLLAGKTITFEIELLEIVE